MTEAVKELVAAADLAWKALAFHPSEERDAKRLRAAVEAVKAEEKPQTHRPAALPHYTDRDEIVENDGCTWGNK
jgi:hypothetical protein